MAADVALAHVHSRLESWFCHKLGAGKMKAHRSEAQAVSNVAIIACVALLISWLFIAPASAQVGGPNVNMVSGTSWPNGDPFLQRQNEPSIAVSTRNPMHILGGANDYRTVDLEIA